MAARSLAYTAKLGGRWMDARPTRAAQLAEALEDYEDDLEEEQR